MQEKRGKKGDKEGGKKTVLQKTPLRKCSQAIGWEKIFAVCIQIVSVALETQL